MDRLDCAIVHFTIMVDSVAVAVKWLSSECKILSLHCQGIKFVVLYIMLLENTEKGYKGYTIPCKYIIKLCRLGSHGISFVEGNFSLPHLLCNPINCYSSLARALSFLGDLLCRQTISFSAPRMIRLLVIL